MRGVSKYLISQYKKLKNKNMDKTIFVGPQGGHYFVSPSGYKVYTHAGSSLGASISAFIVLSIIVGLLATGLNLFVEGFVELVCFIALTRFNYRISPKMKEIISFVFILSLSIFTYHIIKWILEVPEGYVYDEFIGNWDVRWDYSKELNPASNINTIKYYGYMKEQVMKVHFFILPTFIAIMISLLIENDGNKILSFYAYGILFLIVVFQTYHNLGGDWDIIGYSFVSVLIGIGGSFVMEMIKPSNSN